MKMTLYSQFFLNCMHCWLLPFCVSCAMLCLYKLLLLLLWFLLLLFVALMQVFCTYLYAGGAGSSPCKRRSRGDFDVVAAAARSSAGGATVFVAGATMATLGRGVLASADRHGSVSALDVGESLGDGALVITSDVCVVQ